MKKITTILLTLLLGFAMAGCTTQDDAGTPEDVVNPTNLTFSLTDGTDNPDVENFTTIDEDPFIAEEGSTVLEATELYCMSHDMSITIEKNGSYVTEINGFTQGDYTDTTGWVFTVSYTHLHKQYIHDQKCHTAVFRYHDRKPPDVAHPDRGADTRNNNCLLYTSRCV